MPKRPWIKRVVNRVAAHFWAFRHGATLHPRSTYHIWVGERKEIRADRLLRKGFSYDKYGINVPIQKVGSIRHKALIWKDSLNDHEFAHVLQKIWHEKRASKHGIKIDYNSELGAFEELLLRGKGYGIPLHIEKLKKLQTFDALRGFIESRKGAQTHPSSIVTRLSELMSSRFFLRAFRKMFFDENMAPILSEMNDIGHYIKSEPYARWNLAFINYFETFYLRHKNDKNAD